jgi:hypothetical protein
VTLSPFADGRGNSGSTINCGSSALPPAPPRARAKRHCLNMREPKGHPAVTSLTSFSHLASLVLRYEPAYFYRITKKITLKVRCINTVKI